MIAAGVPDERAIFTHVNATWQHNQQREIAYHLIIPAHLHARYERLAARFPSAVSFGFGTFGPPGVDKKIRRLVRGLRLRNASGDEARAKRREQTSLEHRWGIAYLPALLPRLRRG